MAVQVPTPEQVKAAATEVGLSLTDCEVTARGGGYGVPVRATIRLAGAGSQPVDEVQAGFL